MIVRTKRTEPKGNLQYHGQAVPSLRRAAKIGRDVTVTPEFPFWSRQPSKMRKSFATAVWYQYFQGSNPILCLLQATKHKLRLNCTSQPCEPVLRVLTEPVLRGLTQAQRSPLDEPLCYPRHAYTCRQFKLTPISTLVWTRIGSHQFVAMLDTP
jgi:hypothetical protein